MTRAAPLFALALVGAAAPAAGNESPHVLRLASAAPEGTAWAREFKAFARDVATATGGVVQLKWYNGGVAGDELEVGRRIQRGQLDGVASGGMLCERVAPSSRVLHIAGLFPDREGASYVAMRLAPMFADEAMKSGFSILATPSLGPTVMFSREPIRDLSDLRRVKMWRWDLDDVGRATVEAMGVHITPLPLADAGRAYDEGRVDGFFAIPMGALAFQWSAQARYLLDFHLDYLVGCLIIANRALDDIPVEAQRQLRGSVAKFAARLEEVGRQQDESLLSGLFERQGLKRLATSASVRGELLAAARAARDQLGDKLVPHALLERVLALLEDYRAERGTATREPSR